MTGHCDRGWTLSGGLRRATLLFAFATALALVMSGGAYGDSYTLPLGPLHSANDMQSPAAAFPIDGPAIATARRIADATWGYDPCGGDVKLSWNPLSPIINATASWWNPTDGYADPTRNSSCSVTFNELLPFDWPMLCTVLVHEFGHLTGHMHTTDPNSVMFPSYTHPIGECATTPNPQAAVTTASPSPRRRRAPRSSWTQRRVRPRRAPDRAGTAVVSQAALSKQGAQRPTVDAPAGTSLQLPQLMAQFAFPVWSVATLP